MTSHTDDTLVSPRERADLVERNAPREFHLDDPAEIVRLYRECHGYLRTCHHKHGTDWEGRKFAIDALEKLAQFPKPGVTR